MRDFKRIEIARRSPILSKISATINGLSIIKAFKKKDDFIKQFHEIVDDHLAPYYLYFCSMRWLSTRLDIICVSITLSASLFAVFYKNVVGAAYAGLAISLSMQLSGLFQYVVRLGCDVETRLTSVERINFYIRNLKKIEYKPGLQKPVNWPSKGQITFLNVMMKYRKEFPFVLKNITFDINPQEKIG